MRVIPTDGSARLLFFVEQRLAALGWTRDDLAAQGGPSPSTVYKLVRESVQPTERTIARLDRALGWEPGSVHTIMAGGSPTVSLSQAVESVSARIDTELARCEASGVKRTAQELREFLLDVANRLHDFYTGSDGQVGEVLADARTC